ncbi:hypothetical protein NPS01_37770 [Nocardioides psychrotolerans]|uniref:Uncharacterized protein n=1 Tax=Nocardioides psychrotolerans TaxID=1005945 RepID=A0A1I3I6Y0_9ACTN|nr:hypothetical protein [Nocardioides psychrotolerans]GEP40114.1 hypothetical protein NPS01_37770 [Nocardioides psychrotolerans]SFI43649.1 hypothetical protein SAMN05216561_108141 [Nocardioides psychrotolerans]
MLSETWRRRRRDVLRFVTRAPAPGFVRVDKDDHIHTLTAALRATELEAERDTQEASLRGLHAEAAARARGLRAAALLVERTRGTEVVFNELEVAGLMADLPARADALLDQDAFLAALDEHIWTRRLSAITTNA